MSSPCETCGGYGEIANPEVPQYILQSCPDCDGTGYEFTQPELEIYLKLKKLLE